MQLVPFTGCCTARILTGFGQSDTAYREYRPNQNYTKDTMADEIREHILAAGRGGAATIIAITDNQQTTAMEVLPAMGFLLVQAEIGKIAHANKTLNTYVYTVNKEDRQPKPVPANPFVKPVEAKAPVRNAARNVDVRVSAEEVESYRNLRMGERGTRREINERLLANIPRRDAQGRFVAVPVQGVWYTWEQASVFRNLPEGLRYAVPNRVDATLVPRKGYGGGVDRMFAGRHVLFA